MEVNWVGYRFELTTASSPGHLTFGHSHLVLSGRAKAATRGSRKRKAAFIIAEQKSNKGLIDQFRREANKSDC